MATQFVHARVPLLGGAMTAFVDGNSKITAGNGTYDAPAPNAFSCPSSTPTCRASCYVRGLARHAPDVYADYHENGRLLDALRAGPVDRAWRAADDLGAWIAEHCKGGFRWHVSGDVQDTWHALFIVHAVRASANVRHWIYTRTLSAVPTLVLAKNLTVNVSADRDNYADARDVAAQNGARLAYMATPHDFSGQRACAATCYVCGVRDWPADVRARPCVPSDLPDGSVVFPDYPLRGRDLPEPTAHPFWQSLPHRLRVMVCPPDALGQSEEFRCGKCTKCIDPVT